MSRDLEAGADSALQAEHVSQVVFLEFDFLSGVSRVCSREHDVEWNGNTWVGAGRVGSIEPITEGGELEARGLAMSLSALPSGLLAIALDPSEYKGRDVKLWFGQMEESRYLSLPGSSGNYASTPDSAAVSITGDIDIRVKLTLDDWTPSVRQGIARHWFGTEPNRAWDLSITTSTAGAIVFVSTADGVTQRVAASTIPVGFADGSTHWIRVTRDASTGDVIFYTSDDGEVWSKLGATVATTAGGIVDVAQPLLIGVSGSGGDFRMSGKLYHFELRNGIDGPVVAKFDASRMSPGQTSARMPTGEVWTINQSGSPNAHIARDPLSIAASPIGPFIFKMDQLTYQLGQTAALRLTGESRLADWMRPRVRRYNNADHQALHPGDKFFEHTEKQIEQVYRW